jgi:23S rRNA (cytosine1962-C5)-methyltransferase
MVKFIVLKNRVGPIIGRHPWVFSGALKQIPDGIKNGELVTLIDEQDNFLAQGYFNSYSQIAVRLWSWEDGEEINTDFFVKKIRNAYQIRKNYVENKKINSYRLIYAENDLLPGLVVDKYAEYLCVQFHNPGIETWKEQIVDALAKVLNPIGIYERSDMKVRGIEGAKSQVGILFGEIPERIEILENGLKFLVDVKGGQKTGFFLDQRDKRLAVQKYCKDKIVLNCFSYTGGFSVYALQAGAKKVVSVDTSMSAVDLAKENIQFNELNLEKCEFICEDVKEYLASVGANGRSPLPRGVNMFDIIILDPPAFVKDRRKIKEGLQGYRKINEAALRLLPVGGILVTCSCSAHVSLEDFRFMLSEAAGRAKRTVQVLETFTHGIDHPELVAFTEGEYLKCLVAQVF